ncbi:TetR/AcrR family transcriptional regulator [Rhodobacteraceae bacterium B1Z28]|uniref:TetR/AcrR family transcriptional regulator n=1 Tax=Ruegeria haliotis TaxID=2747601 RepID=A0ABX2PX38_9RHOB|nr:TetR/AcrR family transcriptional regulator [Ruegeria haliotis]NVO58087.1 TetR/AcrR family transcriptional regulator [Ruegeria haliotis]
MTKASPPGRPPKTEQRLSKQMILQAALPIVQSKGVYALSFRILADQLGVTPMAVTYHAGSKKRLLSDLVELAFAGVLDGVDGGTPVKRARGIMATYYGYALKNANLLRAILDDVTLMSADLINVAVELKASTDHLENSDGGDVLVHVLIDYAHGFVLSASSGEDNPLTIDGFLRGIDWILGQAVGDRSAV